MIGLSDSEKRDRITENDGRGDMEKINYEIIAKATRYKRKLGDVDRIREERSPVCPKRANLSIEPLNVK